MDASVLVVKALGGGWDIGKLPSIQSLRKRGERALPGAAAVIHGRVIGVYPFSAKETY